MCSKDDMRTRRASSLDALASLVKIGLASSESQTRLASETMRCARIAAIMAVKSGLVTWDDVDDITQSITLKSWRYLQRWESSKGGWSTYVGKIAQSVIGDYGRRNGRRQDAENAYRDMNSSELGADDE